jgi:hypothetical protein
VDDGTLSIHGLQYTGPGATDSLNRTVIANNNPVGLRVTSVLAQITLRYFSASSNNGNGMEFLAGSHVTMRNSDAIANGGSGITIVPPSGSGNRDLSTIDFGDAATGTTAGNNAVYGNTGAGVCLFASATGAISAMGNVFSSNASQACNQTPTAKLTHTPDCAPAVDVAYGVVNGTIRITVDNCAYE